MRTRFLKEERGFTLVEMMVTITIMMIVFFALYSMFDMSVRIFSFGNNKVEGVTSAREGLEKMEREIRGAYRYDSSTGKNYLFFSTASPGTALAVPPAAVTEITFGNDLGAPGAAGTGKIECGTPDDCEYITYKLTDDTSNTPCTPATGPPCSLRRVNTADSNDWGDPLGENAIVPGGLDFTYLKNDGTPPTTESEIGKVRVSLEIRVAPGTKNSANQRLTTEIDLRNR